MISTHPSLLTAVALMVATVFPMSAQAGSRAMADIKSDFSTVTSRQKAAALARRGDLVRILIFPAELGGPDVPENVTYVPPEAAQAQALLIGTLRRFAAEGQVDQMTVDPEYRGESVVPIRIAYHATKVGRKGGFHPTIEVW